MNYLDGFVAAVPLANKEAFLKHAQDAALVFKEYGALQVVESWGDDVPEGKLTSFPLAVKREEGEMKFHRATFGTGSILHQTALAGAAGIKTGQ